MGISSTFWGQIIQGKSPVRALMNLKLAKEPLWEGKILDVGGTTVPIPSYRMFISLLPTATVTTLNIDAASNPDYVGDAMSLPMDNDTFDGAWCLNVLEYLSDPMIAVKEIARVVKPGKPVVFFTPFFVRVHGHPNDYGRYTESGLRLFADRAGLQQIEIEGVGTGPFMAAVAQIQAFCPRVFFVPCLLLAVGFDRLLARIRPKLISNWPLGYYMRAQTPTQTNH
jgi:SAM-dependent methyltransferase